MASRPVRQHRRRVTCITSGRTHINVRLPTAARVRARAKQAGEWQPHQARSCLFTEWTAALHVSCAFERKGQGVRRNRDQQGRDIAGKRLNRFAKESRNADRLDRQLADQGLEDPDARSLDIRRCRNHRRRHPCRSKRGLERRCRRRCGSRVDRRSLSAAGSILSDEVCLRHCNCPRAGNLLHCLVRGVCEWASSPGDRSHADGSLLRHAARGRSCRVDRCGERRYRSFPR